MPPRRKVDVAIAGSWAAVLSGIPSTAHALLTGQDPLAATRAAGAMLIPAKSGDPALIAAAAVVHGSLSAFWAAVLARTLPRRHATPWALAAFAGVAVIDLRLIGRLFPGIRALPFWPQFADHLAWAGVFGAVLQRRDRLGARPRER